MTRRRLVRFTMIGLLAAAALAGVAVWIVTRSWFLAWRLEPLLAQSFGGEFDVALVKYEGDGHFRLEGISMRAPDLDGEAGEICFVGQARVDVVPDSLFSGAPVVTGVRLSGVQLRISEQIDAPGQFNFSGVTAPPESPEVVPPSIQLDDITLLSGLHDANGAFTLRGERRLRGAMRPIDGQSGEYTIVMHEIGPGGASVDGGLTLVGSWDSRTGSHEERLRDLVLDERTLNICPEIVRAWWTRMDVKGDVREIALRWEDASDFTVEVIVEDLGLTIPVLTEGVWARYQDGAFTEASGRPRMNLQRGRIIMEPDRLALEELRGFIVDADAPHAANIPYVVSLEVTDMPKADWSRGQQWMEESVNTAAFTMTFAAEDVAVVPDDAGNPPAIVLPSAIASSLKRFELEEWTLDCSATITRARAGRNAEGKRTPGKLDTFGTARIRDARGAYLPFPYPMRDVSAEFSFNSERILLDRVVGRGSDDCIIEMDGSIAPVSPRGAVNMQIRAADVPIDDTLRTALGERQQRIFDALISQSAHDALAEAGLAVDDAWVRRQRQALAETLAMPIPSNPAAAAALAQHIARLERLARQQPVEPGGRAAIDLDLHRPEGVGTPVYVTGMVDIRHIDLLPEVFPYPVRLQEGRLHWTRQGWVIDEAGAAFETVGGGMGRAHGNVDLRAPVRPDVTLSVSGDMLTEQLLAALPPREPRADWPGAGRSALAEFVAQFGLEGELGYTVHLTERDGAFDWSIGLTMSNGRADIAPLVERLVSSEAAAARSWQVEDLQVTAKASANEIRIDSLAGSLGEATIEATDGVLAINASGTTDMTIDLRGVPINESLPSFVADEAVAGLLRNARLRGATDLTIDMKGDLSAIDAAITIAPHRLSLQPDPDGVRVDLAPTQGDIRMEQGRCTINDLAVDIAVAGAAVGHGRIGGTIDPREGGQLRGSLRDDGIARFIPALLESVGAHAEAAQLRPFRPRGEMDVTFGVTLGAGASIDDYEVRVEPQAIALEVNGLPIHATLERDALVELRPGTIVLTGLRGTTMSGTFDVKGDVRYRGQDLEADLICDYTGRIRSALLEALAPGAAVDALAAIEFEEGSASRIEGAQLRLRRNEDGMSMRLASTVHLADASIEAGGTFSEMSGPIHLEIFTTPNQVPTVDLTLDGVRAQLRNLALVDLEGSLRLNADGTAITLDDLGANSDVGASPGRLTANGSVGLGDAAPWFLDLRLISVPSDGFFDVTTTAALRKPRPGSTYGALALAGVRGDPESRTGRGDLRVLDGELATVPVALRIAQLLQLSIPSATLNYGGASFFLCGSQLYLEDITLESSDQQNRMSMQIRGHGVLDLDSMSIRADVRARSGSVLGFLERIGDQLARIRIAGPIKEPAVELVPLPGLGRENSAPTSPPPRTLSSGQQRSAVHHD